jgi:hypothetical protein
MDVNGPITSNLSHSVTITATSVTDSTKSVSSVVSIWQQYSLALAGNASFGVIGSVTLDGNGNIPVGEVDYSANGQSGHFLVDPSGSSYTLDSTGHGALTLNLTGCCVQTSSITAISNSHLLSAEDDQFSGLSIGGIGSLDLQTAGPSFSMSQLSGGYSFTLAGYSGAYSANASWGGVFTADGEGNITGGIFDENFGGGSGNSSVPFTGTYSAPDANGRGTITLSATPDAPGQCGPTPLPACVQYAYYIVAPEVVRLTTLSLAGKAAGTGSAFGQGSLAGTAGTNAALNGSFIFSDFGFTSDANGGESGAAAGQFTTDGNGNIETGVMDLNAFGTPTTISLAGSTYSISGSARGTITGPSGQTYNVYLTDPNLNLLDPNNTSGTGGALLLETDAADTTGVVIPQTDPGATLAGNYAMLLSDQSNPPNSDGGFTGDFATSTTDVGTFTGEGDFQGQGTNSATPIVGPLSGTFSADGANPGRFVGAITTAPAFPLAPLGSTTPGTENVSYYLANSSQGFVIETDSIAPVFGVVEAQGAIQSAANQRPRVQQRSRTSNESAAPVSGTNKHPEVLRRSR